MSVEGRHFKKPSKQEIYRDAARIVEELLCSRLENDKPDNLQSNFARSSSYRAASVGDVLCEESDENDVCEDDEQLVRTQTAPSRLKTDSKGKEKKQDKKARNRAGSKSKKSAESNHLPSHSNKIDRRNSKSDSKLHNKGIFTRMSKKITTDEYDNSSTSCYESDWDEETKNQAPVVRRKKGFFKKAKERLIRTFHRDEKSDDDDIYIHGPEKDKKRKRVKHKKKVSSVTSHGDVSRNAKANDLTDGKDTSPDYDDGVTFRRNSVGKRFIDSVRKSFRMKKKSHVLESQSAEPVSPGQGKNYSRSSSTPGTSNKDSENPSAPPPPVVKSSKPEYSPAIANKSDKKNIKGDNNKMLDDIFSKFALRAKADHFALGDSSDENSEENSEDDWEEHAGRGPQPPPQPKSFDSKQDQAYEQTDDGLWELKNTGSKPLRHDTDDVKQISLETDGINHSQEDENRENLPFEVKTHEEKEEIISKVVKKLIEIGDNYATQSQSTSESNQISSNEATPAQASAPGDDKLTSLEREILMCLRTGGDKLSATMEDPAAGLIQEAKQNIYDQFSQTIRRTVGDDVSWNQMALVFHATRSAFRAVGVGTNKAQQLKDLTVKYVTDKCASFIYDQGGWESVVSEDSDVD